MAFEITRVDVWAGEIKDQPGALAAKLEALQRAGANLEFVIVRPTAMPPGNGILYVAPLSGAQQEGVAKEAGLRKSNAIHALRIIGPDRPGLVAGVTRTIADEKINISGVSAATIGDRSVLYLRFDSETDARRAAQVLTPRLA